MDVNNSISIVTTILLTAEQQSAIDREDLTVKIKESLYKIDTIWEANKRKEQDEKLTFNVFSCLTKHHREELHTRFIRYLLNAEENHNCQSLFFNLFLEVLNQDKGLALIHPLLQDGLHNVKVHVKEKAIGDFGRADILIESKKLLIIIENKIHAREQDCQIEDYVKYCEQHCQNSNQDFIVFYLTLFGSDSISANGKTYYKLSYSEHITKWLALCINATERYQRVCTGISFYLDLLNKSILQIPPITVTMEIQKLLMQDENKIIIKYLHDLHAALEPIRNELRVSFFKRVPILLGQDYQIRPVKGVKDDISINDIYDTKHNGFLAVDSRFIVDVGANKKIYFLIQHNWINLYYGLVCMEDNKQVFDYWNAENVKRLIEELNKKFNFELEIPDYHWIAWRYASSFTKEAFGSDKLNYEFLENNERLAKEFALEIKHYLTAFDEVLKMLRSNGTLLETN